ncbi:MULTISPECIES: hypothetical protein [Sphingobacterium]|jgi:hypothetical protein|uniref:hypothetical protein n=1 Tax=Sphingobacterium TaxID=28453 RepID=UPI00038A4183|nr:MULTISPECIES: hypothetical protein [Sphingobacterium]KKX47233.1 hypothetical protein L950_0227565 [Sphingobacterium sp. IITKGP-BTPF85]MBB2951225.1 hypothetical protein [Sphingobacterium sp. JUb56]MCW2259670.1 hypothetical protein [Sphingobacterium kitahiroshimense]TCR03485.1 hypothetical protein EDF67_112144 [Sphingobacterium sp. JUb78]
MTYFKKFVYDLKPEYSLLIEDDGKVCYAYLYINNKIVGDIWLYNTMKSPVKAEWHSPDNLPFLNPIEFIKENIETFDDETNIKIKWGLDNKVVALIYISNRLIARLSEGDFPGSSSLVIKDGPLAIVM